MGVRDHHGAVRECVRSLSENRNQEPRYDRTFVGNAELNHTCKNENMVTQAVNLICLWCLLHILDIAAIAQGLESKLLAVNCTTCVYLQLHARLHRIRAGL